MCKVYYWWCDICNSHYTVADTCRWGPCEPWGIDDVPGDTYNRKHVWKPCPRNCGNRRPKKHRRSGHSCCVM
jgi:hypothetical protein